MISKNELDTLIANTLAGHEPASERLFAYVQEIVASMDLSQLGPYRKDPDYRAEVCARVMGQLLTNHGQRLRAYLDRPGQSFHTLLKVITARVVVALARSISETIAARIKSEYRWLQEIAGSEPSAASEQELDQQRWLEAYRYLQDHADPVDVELLRLSVQAPEQWLALVRPHDIEHIAAQQRVDKLRSSLRALVERQAH